MANTKQYCGFGLGCGRLSVADAEKQQESVRVLHGALEQGVTFLNTADFYGAGESELAIGEALKGQKRDQAYISLKFGALMAPSGSMYGLDVHPSRVKNYLTHSLKRMKLDYVDLYQPARIDLAIPVEETVGSIADLVKAGYVRDIGLTQVDADALRKGHAVHPIRYFEAEYSLFNRDIEQDILPVARELGVAVVAFGLLAHGMLSGAWTKERAAEGPPAHNAHIGLFQKGNFEKNIILVERLRLLASEKPCSISQLVHAWALTKGRDIIPLIGVSRLSQFEESLQAKELAFSEEEIKRIEAAIPKAEIAGNSFPNMQFRDGVVVRC